MDDYSLVNVPTRSAVEALMKRCQIGVGGRHALDEAHDIMAECYGTLGALMLVVEQARTALSVVNDLIEVVRMPNVEHVADNHNAAVQRLRAAARGATK